MNKRGQTQLLKGMYCGTELPNIKNGKNNEKEI